MSINDEVNLQFTKADSDRLLRIEMRLDQAVLGLAAVENLRARVALLEQEALMSDDFQVEREKFQAAIDSLRLSNNSAFAVLKVLAMLSAPACGFLIIIIQHFWK